MPSGRLDGSSELISELRALIASGGAMPQVDERKVRSVTDSMVESFGQLQLIAANPYADASEPYYASSIQYHRSRCLRDKRCLLTYLLWRQKQITNAWWTANDNALRTSISPAEQAYLDAYDGVMVEYMTSFAIPLDLRAFLWRPPSVQQLEVRGVTDHVFVSPVTGSTITVYAGKQILLSFEEAERLIQQRVVELVQ